MLEVVELRKELQNVYITNDGKKIYGYTHYVDLDGYSKEIYDWMLDNINTWYYDVAHEPMDGNGDCGGGTSISIIFKTPEDAAAFKLRWI